MGDDSDDSVSHRPSNTMNTLDDCPREHGKINIVSKRKHDASLDVTSKKGRTAVYAGTARSNVYDYVPSLQELCLSLLKDNINIIESVGLAPYHLIEPVLSKCTWKELRRIESFNPILLEETDQLWRHHCRQEFPSEDLNKFHSPRSWRKIFFRLLKAREEKLIKATRHVRKKTNNDAAPVKKTVTINAIALNKRSGKSCNMIPLVRNSVASRTSSAASAMKASAMLTRVSTVKAPPKKAPLMLKTLQMMKQRIQRGHR